MRRLCAIISLGVIAVMIGAAPPPARREVLDPEPPPLVKQPPPVPELTAEQRMRLIRRYEEMIAAYRARGKTAANSERVREMEAALVRLRSKTFHTTPAK